MITIAVGAEVARVVGLFSEQAESVIKLGKDPRFPEKTCCLSDLLCALFIAETGWLKSRHFVNVNEE